MKEANVGRFAMGLIQGGMGIMFLRRVAGLIRFPANVRMSNQIVKVAGGGNTNTLIGRFLGLLRFQRKRALLCHYKGHACRDANQGNGDRMINVDEFQGGGLVAKVRAKGRDGGRHFQASKDGSSIVNYRISVVLNVMTRRFFTVARVSLT